jgi:O-antigen ligase
MLTLTLYFLGSRAGLLAWVVTMSILLIRLFVNIRRHFLVWFSIPTFLILFIFIIIRIDKVEYFIKSTEEKLTEERIDWKNIDVRTRVWYSNIQIIKEKPITGVGLPDVKKRMKEEYIRQNFADEAELNLNAHNQFLETQVTFGVAGALLLLWLLFTPIFQRRQLKFQLQTQLFVFIFVINLLFESMLNRQWGIMFFMLFYCIIVYQKRDEENISAEIV